MEDRSQGVDVRLQSRVLTVEVRVVAVERRVLDLSLRRHECLVEVHAFSLRPSRDAPKRKGGIGNVNTPASLFLAERKPPIESGLPLAALAPLALADADRLQGTGDDIS